VAEAANPLVLPALFQGVIDFFASEAYACESYFGWRGPTLVATTARRLSWVPGDPTGNAGKLLPPVLSEGARPLATLEELFTVYVYAAKVDELGNELAQYTAARLLYDQWFRAIYYAARTVGTGGRLAPIAHTLETAKKERPHGACLRVLCSVQARISDAPDTYATMPITAELIGDTGTTLDGESHGVEETQIIPEPES
jgi:hypothetical protein